jgi:HAD superfamily hydrolase (TIGR01484 family)
MERKIEIVLIDIDDCLLPTENQETENFGGGIDKIRDYVKMAKEGEFPNIAFCTGRDRNYVEAVAFSTGRPNSWSVIESGIALFNPTTKAMPINPALTPEVKEAFERIRRERLPEILKKFPGLFDYPGNMINIALERQYGVDLSIEECYEAIRQELSDLESQGLVTIHHSKIAVDISPPGIDKSSGVQFLSEYTRVNLDHVLGIGDSRGDFPMLKLVGYVGCPANASEECKELIIAKEGYISPFKHACGVADVISHFLEEG